MTTLVIASGNAGKVREFGQLLADLGLETRPQPDGLDVEETGNTFAANARLKSVLVQTGPSAGSLKSAAQPNLTAPDVATAITEILKLSLEPGAGSGETEVGNGATV